MSAPYIGQNYVFQVRFVDGENIPVEPDTDVRISVYSFSSATGARVVHIDNDLMVPAIPAEVGRYVYVFTIPSSLLDGEVLYAETRSSHDGNAYIIEQSVIVKAISSLSGLRARFIR